MSAESLLETTPAALVLVAPPAVETRPVPLWASAVAPISSKLTCALVERDPSSGKEGPDAASSLTPGSAFALAIARAMGVVVVTAHGPLDAANGVVLKSVLADLIEGQGNMKIVVDLHDVAVVDPSSMAVLVASAASAARRGGDFALADPCEAVAAGLEASGLSPAVTMTHRRRLRSLSSETHHPDDEAWRISMAQHPAGDDGDRRHSRPAHIQ